MSLPLPTRAALTTACLSFVASGVIVISSYQGNKQLLLENTSHYGKIIATQLANNAQDALVQQDRVSLQAMLSELAAHPQVLQATIYDVQNQLIAEAGEAGSSLDYPVSITFQDSIAGYAVLSIASATTFAGAASLAWQLLMLSIILTGFVYACALYPARYSSQLQRQTKPLFTRTHQQDFDELETLRKQLAEHEAKTTAAAPINTHKAFLSVGIINLEQSGNDANNSQTAALQWFRKQLEAICQLYDGQLSVSRSNGFIATFEDSDDNNYPFRALCCAYLVKKLQQDQTALQCNFGLALYQQQDALWEFTQQQTMDAAGLVAQRQAGELMTTADYIQHPSLQDRIETMTIDATAITITALKEPYQSLLKQQFKTLKLQQQGWH